MLDKTFNIIMKRMVESGQAPHYTEIAAELSLSMEEGRRALHDLVDLFSVKPFTKRLVTELFFQWSIYGFVSRSRNSARKKTYFLVTIGSGGQCSIDTFDCKR